MNNTLTQTSVEDARAAVAAAFSAFCNAERLDPALESSWTRYILEAD